MIPMRRMSQLLPEAISLTRRTENEIGFAMCQLPNGSIVPGDIAEGTPVSVNIPVQCPPDTRLVGLMHSHPGGVAHPSSTDIESTRALGLNEMCIVVPETGEINCFHFAE